MTDRQKESSDDKQSWAKKYNPILQWIKNYSKKFLPLKGRWIQKRQFLKTEGFSSRSMVYGLL